jgi:hypothetical protein
VSKLLRTAVLAAGCLADASLAAWHDQEPGNGVPVHYVRLAGHGGDNAANRTHLATTYRACAETQAAFSRPYEPAAASPPIVQSHAAEIYYAANRTLTLKEGVLHYIDPTTCALAQRPHRILELRSRAGRCEVDLLKKEAWGECDAEAHARAAAVPGMPAVTGAATRTILGTPCQVHGVPELKTHVCVSHPVPTRGRPRAPYPIPPAPLNGGRPGVVLDIDTPALTLQAQEVRWNLSVSPKLFELPAGIRMRAPRAGALR